MKKVNFFAMLAAAALMTGVTSCSNDDNVGDGGPEGQGKSASLTISIKNPSGTRAIDNATTPMASDDNTVTNLTAYVFDGNGACLASKYFSTTTNEHDGFSRVKIDGITTAAAEVYVVANAGNQETLAAVGSAKTALIAKTQTLGSQFTKRWATGSVVISSTDWTASGTDGTMSAHVDATLEFMAARIVVKVVNGMTGYDASDAAKIKLDSVGVLSVISESCYLKTLVHWFLELRPIGQVLMCRTLPRQLKQKIPCWLTSMTIPPMQHPPLTRHSTIMYMRMMLLLQQSYRLL